MRRRIPLVLALAVFVSGARASLQAQSVTDVFNRVSDAVVVVRTTQTQYPLFTMEAPVDVEGNGSGVLIAPNRILTAAHVVQAANEVLVEFPSGVTTPARVVATDVNHDVALLELPEPASVAPLPIGEASAVQVGEQVMVIGAPLGEEHTLTVGYISARRKRPGLLYQDSEVEFLQTDAAINPGNSGGPMFNMRGEVIGIVSYILTLSGGSMGLGYAVEASDAHNYLLDGGSVWTGMESIPVTGELAALLNVPAPGGGFLVQHVAEGSLAHELGLRPSTIPVEIMGKEVLIGGDIIVNVHGIPVGGGLEGGPRIQQALRRLRPGSIVAVTVLRGGQLQVLAAPKR